MIMCWRPEMPHSVREFVEKAFSHIGRQIVWRGKGADEKGYDAANNQVLVEEPSWLRARFSPDPRHDSLIGDPSEGARNSVGDTGFRLMRWCRR